jgi:hypothetical protein
MDLAGENWSLPWHRLQKNLARDIHAEAAFGVAPGANALDAQRLAHAASSWLGRAQRRAGFEPATKNKIASFCPQNVTLTGHDRGSTG